MKQIKSIKELKEICQSQPDEWFDFFISFGIARSSKTISWQEDTFVVVNEIDDTVQELDEKQLEDESLTNIGEAIKKGSFYQY